MDHAARIERQESLGTHGLGRQLNLDEQIGRMTFGGSTHNSRPSSSGCMTGGNAKTGARNWGKRKGNRSQRSRALRRNWTRPTGPHMMTKVSGTTAFKTRQQLISSLNRRMRTLSGARAMTYGSLRSGDVQRAIPMLNQHPSKLSSSMSPRGSQLAEVWTCPGVCWFRLPDYWWSSSPPPTPDYGGGAVDYPCYPIFTPTPARLV